MAQHPQSQPVGCDRRPAADRRSPPAKGSGRWPGDCWSPGRRPTGGRLPGDRCPTGGRPSLATHGRQPLVGARSAAPTTGRRPPQRGCPTLSTPCPLCPTSLPTKFCTCGQLFLIGCSTCPPCPDFSLKLQTSITFDP
jgi:hypothetical protein